MKAFLVFAALVALGILFALQHRTAGAPATAMPTNASRPVSEHDWAKQALDTTAKVRRDVARQRAEEKP
ncbi:MAG: hypothetical protein M3Z64_11000 [Verrucomicrobiota bacterium]|nr:hypothetical protein [Verrucomicrobiota bacterium]